MKKTLLMMIAVGGLFLAGCTSVNHSMREPNTRVELYADDFELSSQVSASAKSTRILGIDFERLFRQETGSVSRDGISALPVGFDIASVPVVGSFVSDPTAQYALYNLMEANPGYDVVFYPSFKTTYEKPIGLPIFTISTVEVTAKLAKMK